MTGNAGNLPAPAATRTDGRFVLAVPLRLETDVPAIRFVLAVRRSPVGRFVLAVLQNLAIRAGLLRGFVQRIALGFDQAVPVLAVRLRAVLMSVADLRRAVLT